jgi:hypothetical protein
VARAAWRDEIASVDPARLIFLDETSTPTRLTPLRGRSLRGRRVVGRVPRGRWEAVTFVATLTSIGLGPGLQLVDTVARDAFGILVIEALVPSLRPNDIMVLEDSSVHKSAGVRTASEAVGARPVLLPPYSPNFYPIDQVFAKLNQALLAATQDLYPRITASGALGHCRHAGHFLVNAAIGHLLALSPEARC